MVNKSLFKLQYCFSPGEEDDGVTAVIPLGALNQLDENDFSWLVPGFIAEKVTTLLKGLSKSIRKQLVPIPEFTKLVVKNLQDDFKVTNCSERSDLLVRMAQLIKAEKSIQVNAGDWRVDSLPNHLRMRFVVLSEKGKPLGAGRSLVDLRSQFSVHAADEVKKIKADITWPESGATSWQFSDLPESLEVERGGHQYLLYPAIVDKHDSVGVELMDSLYSAQVNQVAGLHRLVSLCHAKEVKYMVRNFPSIDSMCLLYSTLGTCDALKEGLLSLVLSRSYFSKNSEYAVRTEQQFSECLNNRKPLMLEAKEACKTVADILTLYQKVHQRVTQQSVGFPTASREDVSNQLDGLMSANFLSGTPSEWLPHVPRYLKALDVRLQKLSENPAMDAEKLQQVRPFVERYRQLISQPEAAAFSAELVRLKWMIEEFRVSLFAQTLKTSIPISAKRIEKQIALCS